MALAGSPENLCGRNAANAKEELRECIVIDERDSTKKTITTNRLHMEKILGSYYNQSTILNPKYQNEMSREIEFSTITLVMV